MILYQHEKAPLMRITAGLFVFCSLRGERVAGCFCVALLGGGRETVLPFRDDERPVDDLQVKEVVVESAGPAEAAVDDESVDLAREVHVHRQDAHELGVDRLLGERGLRLRGDHVRPGVTVAARDLGQQVVDVPRDGRLQIGCGGRSGWHGHGRACTERSGDGGNATPSRQTGERTTRHGTSHRKPPRLCAECDGKSAHLIGSLTERSALHEATDRKGSMKN